MSEKTQGPKAESQMFGRDKTLNYIVWKRQNSEFQCLQK